MKNVRELSILIELQIEPHFFLHFILQFIWQDLAIAFKNFNKRKSKIYH